MKTKRFTNSWLVTLGLGTLIGALLIIINENKNDIIRLDIGFIVIFGVLFFCVSAISSIPFISTIAYFNKRWTKQRLSKNTFHTRIFLLHFAISLLTGIIWNIAFGKGKLIWELVGITFGYFVIHSILIYININKYYGEKFEDDYKESNPSLLDDF